MGVAEVLACIDRSSYANSVCDHAAWFAGRMDARIEVVHVVEPRRADPGPLPPAERDPVEDALSRLRDEGAVGAAGRSVDGWFDRMVADLPAELLVMGKRGAGHEEERAVLGSSVERAIRGTERPVCFTSKTFLPINRVLVIVDADPARQDAVEFLASHPGLNGVESDLVVMAEDGEDPEPKLQWARERLAAASAGIFALEAEGPDEAASRYMETAGTDLIMISRAVLLTGAERRLRPVVERGVWAFRTPVLVC